MTPREAPRAIPLRVIPGALLLGAAIQAVRFGAVGGLATVTKGIGPRIAEL